MSCRCDSFGVTLDKQHVLRDFLSLQDTKTESSLNTVKLNFLILLCVTEDQYANALMHDPNLAFRVKLHRAPMRHRKPNSQWDVDSGPKSLASAILDLMVLMHITKHSIAFTATKICTHNVIDYIVVIDILYRLNLSARI